MRGKLFLRRLLADDRGATAVEYALILALIFFAIVGVVQSMASQQNALWAKVENKIDSVM